VIPLIWIPGHMCDARLYAPQAGNWPGPETTAETGLDDDLGAMAERLLAGAPPRVVLAGLSMGAMVAMEAMARAPGRIAGALLMDTDPTAARPREIDWRAGEMDRMARTGPQGYVERFVAKFYAHDAAVAARLGPATRAMMGATPADVIRAQARALDKRRDLTGALAGFAGPVEIVVGAEDRVCPPKLHRPLAGALPDAALTEIAGCGHIATLEAPGPVGDRLAALARRIGA